MNSTQKQIVSNWRSTLWSYLAHEWYRAAIGYSLGALLAAALVLLENVHVSALHSLIHSAKPVPSISSLMSPYCWFAFGPGLLVLGVAVGRTIVLAIRSCISGVASFSFAWPFLTAAVTFFALPVSVRAGTISMLMASLILPIGFVMRLMNFVRRERTFDMQNLRLHKAANKPLAAGRDPSSPVEYLQEDRLGRSAFVEMLARNILLSKASVVALRGKFGDGKSSVLNMLRQELGSNAVVVSFSSWLPDSHKALAADLLSDIGAEIRKHYLVPGLRKRLRDVTSLVAGGVPYLKALPDILPPYTQRQELTDLSALLGRIPRRVVVLLDEMDCMQKEELLMLLKVIKGAVAIPNVTFVCSFDQEQVEKTVCDTYDQSSHEFMEKFFPNWD